MGSISDFRTLNLGYCELELVAFLGRNVRFTINDGFNNETVVVEFVGVDYVFMESDHFQNVISEIEIFENAEDVLAHEYAKRFIVNRNIVVDKKHRKFAYMMPIAGFEAFLAFNEIEWNHIKKSRS